MKLIDVLKSLKNDDTEILIDGETKTFGFLYTNVDCTVQELKVEVKQKDVSDSGNMYGTTIVVPVLNIILSKEGVDNR